MSKKLYRYTLTMLYEVEAESDEIAWEGLCEHVAYANEPRFFNDIEYEEEEIEEDE